MAFPWAVALQSIHNLGPQLETGPCSFESSGYNFESLDQINAPVNERCGERRSPKVQPSTRPEIKSRISWLAVSDLIKLTALTAHFERCMNVKSPLTPRIGDGYAFKNPCQLTTHTRFPWTITPFLKKFKCA